MSRYKEEVVTEEMKALAGTIQWLSLDYKRQFAAANEIKALIESCDLGLW